MNIYWLFSVAFALIVLFIVSDTIVINKIDSSLTSEWEAFKIKFNKRYGANGNQETARRLIWESNLKYIKDHNYKAHKGVHSYHLEMNHFGDYTHEEFKTVSMGLKLEREKQNQGQKFHNPLNRDQTKSVNWVERGYVTEVKDQGLCGSCWAFSSTGALEGQLMRKNGVLPRLSEQQLVDCSYSFDNSGCDGGLMHSAFNYTGLYGIEEESTYPYLATNGHCRYKESKVTAKAKGYVEIEEGNENDLKQATATVGPISVAIDANHESLKFYSHGIYQERNCSSEKLSHGVLVVGYGPGYWLVKNSWGTTWGRDGYCKIARDMDNHCGIATAAVYPLV